MSLATRVANRIERHRIEKLTGDAVLARELVHRGTKASDLCWNESDSSFLYSPLGIRIDAKRHRFVVEETRFVQALKDIGARFERRSDNELLVRIDDLTFNLQTWEELYILNEVFVLETYGAKLNQPFVAIDIGMNTGMTSLYFAARPDVVRVHGYEPILPTYEQALVNLRLNPQVAGKIDHRQFGLGASDRVLEVDYSPDRRGSVGIHGLADYARKQVSDGSMRKEKLSVRKASDELERVLDAAGQHPVVMKIDCEGAEYEIVSDLAAAGLLPRFHAILCEWHLRGAEELQTHFLAAGMKTLSVAFDPGPVGMVYAFR